MLRSTAHDERRSLRAQGPRGGAAAVRACAALACLLLLALPLGSAYAQAAANDRGHETPILREDAQALRLHPAQLAYVSGAHASVMLRGGDEGVRGGAALALGIPSLLGVGYGWESTTDVASLHRLGVAIGGSRAALGLSHRWSEELAPTTLGSVQLRVMPWLGAALGLDSLLEGRARDRIGRALFASLALRSRHGRSGWETTWARQLQTAPQARTEVTSTLRLGRAAPSDAGWLVQAAWRDSSEDPWRLLVGLWWAVGTMRTSGSWLPMGPEEGPRYAVEVELASGAFAHGPPPGRVLYVVEVPIPAQDGPSSGWLRPRDEGWFLWLRNLRRIRREAGADAGLLVLVDAPDLGAARWDELRRELAAWRAGGYTVTLYAQELSPSVLYAAGAADRLLVHPAATLDDAGFSSSVPYFGAFFARVGVEAQFIRIGAYKSAPEPLLLEEPSDEEREQVRALLEARWDRVRTGTSERADIASEGWERLLREAPVLGTELADMGMASAALHRDEVIPWVRRAQGPGTRVLRIEELPQPVDRRWPTGRRIVTLFIEGAIVTGESRRNPLTGETFVGDETVIRWAEELRADPEVAGILVRIDSPGGSAYGSERMHRALQRLAETKPTVVSMGNAAASGGYYVAAIGAPIFANPGTLTGSIGVFVGRWSVDDLLARWGINVHREAVGGVSGLFAFPGQRWTDDDIARLTRHTQAVYNTFVERVAAGRSMEREAVEAVAAGRVWIGDAALTQGLADHSGGVLEAYDHLLDLLGLPESRVEVELRAATDRGGLPLAVAAEVVDARQPPLLPALVAHHRALTTVLGLALVHREGGVSALCPVAASRLP